LGTDLILKRKSTWTKSTAGQRRALVEGSSCHHSVRPNFFNSDMSIFKNVAIYERVTAQFRMDAFNALNHINYGNPNGAIDQTSSGAITGGPFPAGLGGTTNSRQLQFTLHLQF
jgi:hypothetical protein